MGRREIDEMLTWGAQRNIEIRSIILKASDYEKLIVDLRSTMIHHVNPWKDIGVLTYKTTEIRRQKCEGCCAHA